MDTGAASKPVRGRLVSERDGQEMQPSRKVRPRSGGGGRGDRCWLLLPQLLPPLGGTPPPPSQEPPPHSQPCPPARAAPMPGEAEALRSGLGELLP